MQGASAAVLGRYLANLWFRVVAPGAFGLYVPHADDSTLVVPGPVPNSPGSLRN